MPDDWRNGYLAELQEAERNNPVNKDLVEACSQLADRIASLEAEKAAALASTSTTAVTPPTTTKTKTTSNTTNPSQEETVQLRLDLAEALRGRGQAQARLKAAEAELATLQSKTKSDARRIGDLTSERSALVARVRDLNEELEKKRKFLKDVQDDNLTLNMELNVTTEKVAKVQAENKELVDRWMKRMAREADAMNLQNEKPNKINR